MQQLQFALSLNPRGSPQVFHQTHDSSSASDSLNLRARMMFAPAVGRFDSAAFG